VDRLKAIVVKKVHPAAWTALIFGGLIILLLVALLVAPETIDLRDATLQD